MVREMSVLINATSYVFKQVEGIIDALINLNFPGSLDLNRQVQVPTQILLIINKLKLTM